MFAGIVRRAVALGRFIQNPLAMVASLCGPTKEVLSLRLHPHQSFLTEEEIYEAIERVMVTVTNQVSTVEAFLRVLLNLFSVSDSFCLSSLLSSFKQNRLDLLSSMMSEIYYYFLH